MRLAISIFSILFSLYAWSSSLPPEHESARLLLVIEEAVGQQNWQLADESLSKMADLQVELPVPFFFYNGWVNFKQSRLEKAQRSLEHYVVKAGSSGAFYYDALRLLTSIEESLLVVKPAAISSGESQSEGESITEQPLLDGQDRDAYVQSLKALYLTDNSINALVMQINSLLSAHSFTGSRVKKVSEKQGVKFQISIQNNVIVLQEKNYQDGFPQLTATRFEMSGVDPFVKFECSGREMMCWILDPAGLHTRWLYFDNDSLVAGELSQAITKLIQLLQQH